MIVKEKKEQRSILERMISHLKSYMAGEDSYHVYYNYYPLIQCKEQNILLNDLETELKKYKKIRMSLIFKRKEQFFISYH